MKVRSISYYVYIPSVMCGNVLVCTSAHISRTLSVYTNTVSVVCFGSSWTSWCKCVCACVTCELCCGLCVCVVWLFFLAS